MNTTSLVVQLIIEGAVVIPDVLSPTELEAMRRGFERCASAKGRRWLSWEDICFDPDLMTYILHPRLMDVVNGFYRHFNEEGVFANSSGMRDVYGEKEKATFKQFDPTPRNLRHGPMGWHDDVMGIKKPDARILPHALTSLLYLDDTFPHSGAYCTAVGSHHLAYATPENKPVLCPAEVVLDHCELRPMPLKAGSVIVHRAHEWHAVVPVGQMRRIFLQTFTSRSTYDFQEGHTQVSPETAKLIPVDRHGQLNWYTTAKA